MNIISDILMSAGAFAAAIYCFVLSARLKKFTALESGMGGAIAVLSVQVDDMTKALDRARGAATGSASSLENMTTRAEVVAARIELLLAAMHDLPEAGPAPTTVADPDEDGAGRLRFVRRRTLRGDLEAAE